MQLTGTTKLYGLLGDPVAHSRSPVMHNTAFAALGIDAAYLAFCVPQERLKTAVEGLKAIGAAGWNCTTPHKTAMVPLCDTLSPAAELIGAVNTVINENGMLHGHNTDGVGFVRSLEEAGISIKGRKLVIFGLGGAATAMLVQSALSGAAEISIFNRNSPSFERAKPLMERLNQKTDCRVTLYDSADHAILTEKLAGSDLLANGTTLGMSPHEEGCIIPDEMPIPSHLAVFDAVYLPVETKLLKRAEAAGCKTVSGLPLLLWQGAEAFSLWTGQEMPVQQVRPVVLG